MNQQVCKNCLSSDIETNEGRGEVICLGCGSVLEENKIVESLEFVENNNGSVSMVGQFIPSNGNKSFVLSWGIRESREISLQKGYINIQKISDHLHLSNQHIEAAQRIYLMALQRNFTMGRNNSYVAASCLYTICRREKSPIMLIDFSDILQTPVKPLGKTFLKLLRLLHINVPNIDPSLFLERFAHKLNLSNDIYKITYTGIKLIQAMTRDWISTGRRPTGLCGAALLISTRMHGLSINSNLIADIVRISNPTIIKRLSEFKNTNTAKIKASDFDKISITDIPSNNIPPCVLYDNKKKIKYFLQEKNKTLSLCDTEEQDNGSIKSIFDKDSFNEDISSQKENYANSFNAYSEISLNDVPFLDSASRNDEVSHNEIGELLANGIVDKEKGKSTNEKIDEEERKSNNSHGHNEINLEEICNENPKGNDIDNLALKIMNTINIENNSNSLKNVNNKFLINHHKKIDNNTNIENYQPKIKKVELFMDSFSVKSITPIDSVNKLSGAESYISASNISDNHSEFNNSNIINESGSLINEQIKCTKKTNTDINNNIKEGIKDGTSYAKNNDDNSTSSISNNNISKLCSKDSNSSNASLINSCSETTYMNTSNSIENDNSVSNQTIIYEDYSLHKEKQVAIDSNFCTTLNETVNSELSNILNNTEEYNSLYMGIQNQNNNYKKNMDTANSITDFNYFFQDNSNSINDQNTASYVHSDASIDQYDETLNDIYDSEIENMILTEKEKQIKILIWDDVMKNDIPNLRKHLRSQKKRNSDENNIEKKK